jgi:AcrR family transcriptional regulator
VSSVNVSNPSRREVAALQTRREILDAARRLFLRDGYVGTTVDAIADEARVAVQTIYNTFGSKGAVLSRLLDVTIVGDHEEASVLERVRARMDLETVEPIAVVKDLARTAAQIVARISDVWDVVESGAAVDPEIAALVARIEAERLRGHTFAARVIKARGGLRPGLSVPGAAAVIWSITGVRNHRFLVVGQGWSQERYRRWLEDALATALLRQET